MFPTLEHGWSCADLPKNQPSSGCSLCNGSLYFSLGRSFFTSPFFFDDTADEKWPAPRPDGLLHFLLGEEDLHRNRPLSTTSLCFIWMDDHGWPYHPRFSNDLGLIHDIIYGTKNNVSLRPYHTRVREMPWVSPWKQLVQTPIGPQLSTHHFPLGWYHWHPQACWQSACER